MAFDELTHFLQDCADADALLRVAEPIAIEGEIVEFARQAVKELAGNPVLFFEQAGSTGIPVVTNELATAPRFLKALGVNQFAELSERVMRILSPFPNVTNWTETFSHSGAAERNRMSPRVIKRGACQQVVHVGRDVDLALLPIACSEEGTSATLHRVPVTMKTRDGRPLCVVASAVVNGVDQLILSIEDRRFHTLVREHVHANQQLAVTIFMGGDPTLPFTTTAPVPGPVDPFFLAGVLRGEPFNLVRGHTVDVPVPADAEIVIEGMIDPVEPTGATIVPDRFGLWKTTEHCPVLQVTAITHRANPIFPMALRSGHLCNEWIAAQLNAAVLLPLLKGLVPEVSGLRFPESGAGQAMAFVSVNQSSEAVIEQVRHALGALPVSCETKMIVVVDSNVDITDDAAVWRSALSRGGIPDVDSTGRCLLAAPVENQESAVTQADRTTADKIEFESRILQKLKSTGWNRVQDAVTTGEQL